MFKHEWDNICVNQPDQALPAVFLQYFINARRLEYKGQQSITAKQERNFLAPEMYSAASIGERQQGKLQYTCIKTVNVIPQIIQLHKK